MKLQGIKRIVQENFEQEYRDVVAKVGDSFNSLAEDVSNALNKNLTIDDNLNMQWKEITLSVNANGTPKITTQYRSTLRGKTRGISVEKVENLTNTNTYPTGAPFITFSENNQVITINHITGLSVGNEYKITILAKG